jgi:hypothetical protein
VVAQHQMLGTKIKMPAVKINNREWTGRERSWQAVFAVVWSRDRRSRAKCTDAGHEPQFSTAIQSANTLGSYLNDKSLRTSQLDKRVNPLSVTTRIGSRENNPDFRSHPNQTMTEIEKYH